jgi:hypothetical protein
MIDFERKCLIEFERKCVIGCDLVCEEMCDRVWRGSVMKGSFQPVRTSAFLHFVRKTVLRFTPKSPMGSHCHRQEIRSQLVKKTALNGLE